MKLNNIGVETTTNIRARFVGGSFLVFNMFEEYKGKRFGNLTITSFDSFKSNGNPLFNVSCDCGNVFLKVGLEKLVSGEVKDCGCSKRNCNLIGKKYGRLLVIEKTEKRSKRSIVWKCQCDCGNFCYVSSRALNYGTVKSCGCLKKEKEHFATNLPIHKMWGSMLNRCYNSNNESYYLYGARGIKVCDEWLGSNPKGFANFYNWAMANGYSDEKLPSGRAKYTIDRIDNEKGYCPENCRFVTNDVQTENKRNRIKVWYKGEYVLATKVADMNSVEKSLFCARIRRGYSVHDALTIPKKIVKKSVRHKEGYFTKREIFDKYKITQKQIRHIIKNNKISYIIEKNTYFFLEEHIKKLSEHLKGFSKKYCKKYKDFNL